MTERKFDRIEPGDPPDHAEGANPIPASKGCIRTLQLKDILDVQLIQSLIDVFFKLTRISVSIVDLRGDIVVTTGWQDICTRFHRVHPEANRRCIESDTELCAGVAPGTFKSYICKNNLWNMSTPIILGGEHVGNLFLSQFFLENESLDYELFRRQAHAFGFDEGDYISALEKVPRVSRTVMDTAMTFFVKLAALIASLGHGNVKLARALSEKDVLLRELRESEERFRLAFENANVGMCLVNTEGRITKANRHMSEIFGFSQTELERMTVNDIAHPDDYRDIGTNYLTHAKSGEIEHSDLEKRYVHKEGHVVWTLVSSSLIRDASGNPIYFIYHIRDITYRKRAEAEKEKLQGQLLQAQKMESVGRLAGGVAHDFNNMLQAILGHAEMALYQVGPEQPLYENLQEIQKAAQRSADLTRQLLAFARKQSISPRILDLNVTVSGMLKMLQRLIGEDINLVWKPGAGLRPVRMDPTQIDQILANLSVNARDAIVGVGNLTIETQNVFFDKTYCAAHVGFVSGEYVLLGVSDTGSGMDKEVLGHLFEPFFTTKEVGKGTGLGLATVYGIVKQNDGFINVYSEPGKGTTIKIYFRSVEAESEARAAISEREIARGDETVLLVEDEEAILNFGKTILERFGYTVLAARTPGEAIALAERQESPIRLLITDVVMPQMNGRDLSERIAVLIPGIRTLYMSGYTSNLIVHHGVLKAGVHFLQKPFSVHTLVAKVREVLDLDG